MRTPRGVEGDIKAKKKSTFTFVSGNIKHFYIIYSFSSTKGV